MKNFKTVLFGIFSAIVMLTSQSTLAKDIVITKSELPKKALAFMDTHFNAKTIQLVEKDVDLLSVSYKVTFPDQIEIEFDQSGAWEEVDGNKNQLPTTFLLKPIVDYITANYPGAHVIKVSNERRRYEVELNNGLELEFSKSGEFKRIDH